MSDYINGWKVFKFDDEHSDYDKSINNIKVYICRYRDINQFSVENIGLFNVLYDHFGSSTNTKDLDVFLMEFEEIFLKYSKLKVFL